MRGSPSPAVLSQVRLPRRVPSPPAARVEPFGPGTGNSKHLGRTSGPVPSLSVSFHYSGGGTGDDSAPPTTPCPPRAGQARAQPRTRSGRPRTTRVQPAATARTVRRALLNAVTSPRRRRHLRTRLKTVPGPEAKPPSCVGPYRPLVAMSGNNGLLAAFPPPTSRGLCKAGR